MNAKLSKQRFWHCHENELIKTIQTIPHNLYVSVKSAFPFLGIRIKQDKPASKAKGRKLSVWTFSWQFQNLCWLRLGFIKDLRVVCPLKVALVVRPSAVPAVPIIWPSILLGIVVAVSRCRHSWGSYIPVHNFQFSQIIRSKGWEHDCGCVGWLNDRLELEHTFFIGLAWVLGSTPVKNWYCNGSQCEWKKSSKALFHGRFH